MSATAPPKAFVIGWPIAQSRSPVIHRYWLEKYSIAGSYEAIAVEPDRVSAFLAGFADVEVASADLSALKERLEQTADPGVIAEFARPAAEAPAPSRATAPSLVVSPAMCR